MDVDPHKSVNPPHGLYGPVSKKRVRKTSTAAPGHVGEGADVFNGSELQEVIRSSLDSMPEVRRHLVETGRELAEDDDYPNAKGMDDLSLLALRHFIAAREEEDA